MTQGTKARTACRQHLGKFSGEWYLFSLTAAPLSCRPPGVWTLCYRHIFEQQLEVLFKSERIKEKL